MRLRSATLLVASALVLAGCGSSDVEPRADRDGQPSGGTPTSRSAPTAVPTSSITCSSPAPTGTFTYSTDRVGLAELVDLIGEPLTPGSFSNTFDDVDAAELGLLIERGFVDPGGDTNGSPTMWEFHEFLCRHPEVRAIGFVASTLEGIDAVASLETVYAETISPALRRDARSFCRTTPERTLRGHLECFWD